LPRCPSEPYNSGHDGGLHIDAAPVAPETPVTAPIAAPAGAEASEPAEPADEAKPRPSPLALLLDAMQQKLAANEIDAAVSIARTVLPYTHATMRGASARPTRHAKAGELTDDELAGRLAEAEARIRKTIGDPGQS
jgi:hypothetical protein